MTDINIGALAENLNYKSDLDLGNTSPQLVDYIVEQQLPSADNNYTWYNKYKSGRVEQGGSLESTLGTDYDVTLAVTMSDTRYTVIAQGWYSGGAATLITNKTINGFKIKGNVGKDGWYVSGMTSS